MSRARLQGQATLAPAEAGDARTQSARSVYGPRSAPLFYTALQRPPEHLVVRELPCAPPWRVTLCAADSGGRGTPLQAAILAGTEIVWPLTETAFRPGPVYVWRVQPGADVEMPAQEGRFWLLDPDRAAHLERGREALDEVADPDFAAIALALLMTELGLYQDALKWIKNGPARSVRASRVLLAHSVQALVYRQMGKRLSSEMLPACFGVWAENRERYHHEAGKTHEATRTRVMTPGRFASRPYPFLPVRRVA